MFASGNTARAEERNIASVIESARLETPADALQRGMSERNAVNIAARLQVIANPGGIADPVRKNIAFLNDDVADMYADAEFDPPVWRHRGNKNAMKHGLAADSLHHREHLALHYRGAVRLKSTLSAGAEPRPRPRQSTEREQRARIVGEWSHRDRLVCDPTKPTARHD